MEVTRCPKCNSNDVARLEYRNESKLQQRQLRCRACGWSWWVRKIVQRYSFQTVTLCPECHTQGRQTSTQGRVRYHKCPACGENYKEIGTPVELNT